MKEIEQCPVLAELNIVPVSTSESGKTHNSWYIGYNTKKELL